MSLLNDMLRDLAQQPDSRVSAQGDAGDAQRAQLQESGMVKSPRSNWRFSAAVFVLVFAVFILAKMLWPITPPAQAVLQVVATEVEVGAEQDALPNREELQLPISSDPQPINLEKNNQEQVNPAQISQEQINQEQAHQEQINQEQINQEQINQEKINQEQINQEQINQEQINQEQIDQWLSLARQALARDRLTSPIEDNAYSYYQQVLALDANNTLAQQGLLQIAERYLAMAQRQYQRANVAEADTLIKRALKVAPDYEPLQSFANTLATAIANASTNPPANSLPYEPAPTQAPTQNSEQQIQPSVAAASAAGDRRLDVYPNSEWRDQQQHAQAQALWASGQQQLAIEQLDAYVTANPDTSPQATLLLLDFYCQLGDAAAAAQLLQQTQVLAEVDRQYIAARLSLLQGDDAQALQQLEQKLELANQHENYRALLGGLYQKLAYYQQAANTYQGLLQTFGDKPAYWLGYALALDALDNRPQALQAYQRLAEQGDLQAEVRDYIEQRIAALRG